MKRSPGKALNKKDQENRQERVVENYLQAKARGDKTQIKIFEAILIKLGIKVPKI